MGNRKGIIYEAIERLNTKMAIGISRFAQKQTHRQAGEQFWTFTSGQIHSHGTRKAYQQHVIQFIQWARAAYDIHRLDVLDQRAEELVVEYLSERLEKGYSSYTIQAERSALRLFFDTRDLAETIIIPPRTRATITRSRGTALRDQEFQPDNWQPLIRFLRATGLRRTEVELLQVEDIQQNQVTGKLEVAVKKGHGKGGRPRQVPVLPGREQDVLAQSEGREPKALVFLRIPSHLDIHALRREYAQAYYHHLSGRDLPPSVDQRLKSADYDETAVREVSRALGHNRKDVILKHYLR